MKRLVSLAIVLCMLLSCVPAMAEGGGVTTVAGGYIYSLAIKEDGSLWAWGYNRFGQIGDGTTENKYAPVKIMEDVTAVSGGGAIIALP